jgi:hypothetical protein
MKRSAFKDISRVGLCTAFFALPGASQNAFAVENAQNFYLLGQRGPLAGVTPPPGLYFQDPVYFYDGSAGANHEFELGGNVVAGVRSNAELSVPTVVWVTPATILGGNLGFSLSEVIGHIGVSVDATLTGPLGFLSRGVSASDNTTTVGDPIAAAFIGWASGNFHWQVAETVNVPIGDYIDGALANVALHRWVGDTTGSWTWLDPKVGVDVSGAVGITFNGENFATNYVSGTEFHLEGAVLKYLSKDFSIGPAGYFYDQFTPDGGPGDKIGPFEGRVIALGGAMTYNFALGKIPVATSARVYREFDATNRLQGTAGWLTMAIPLP